MADTFDCSKRRAIMRTIRLRDSVPEVVVRDFFNGAGYYTVARPNDVEGRPDIYLPDARTAIFVHGCFWHGHTACSRGAQRPKTNPGFWAEKIRRNRRRDARVARHLRAAGHHVLVVWQCEIRRRRPPARVINTVRRLCGY